MPLLEACRIHRTAGAAVLAVALAVSLAAALARPIPVVQALVGRSPWLAAFHPYRLVAFLLVDHLQEAGHQQQQK